MPTPITKEEVVTLLAKVIEVSEIPPVTDLTVSMWHEILGNYSYGEAESAVLAIAKNLKGRDRILPGQVYRVIYDRRDQYAMSHPANPSVAGLEWSHRAGRYIIASKEGES